MHTVIVGGGIAGIKAAREISKRGIGKVTLIAPNPEFLYHSMLYAAASGGLSSESVAINDIFAEDKNVAVVDGVLKDFNVEQKEVICTTGTYKYDELVLAVGASVNFFDVPGANHHSFTIETLQKANDLRKHIHDDIAINHRLEKRYVVVGGGLTGVELAGAIGAYIRKTATAHGITKNRVHVLLVESEDRLLPLCSRTASSKATKRLKKLGVAVRVGQRVESLTGDHIVIDGKKLSTRTVMWTCGSRGNVLFAEYPRLFKTDEDGRAIVDGHLLARDNIFVIGDSAALPYGGRVSAALREAAYVAQYLERKVHNQSTHTYKPVRAATCLQIGDKWAYVEKYGIYAAGTTGYALFRLHERFALESLLPTSMPGQVLSMKNNFATDCKLCDT